MVWFAPTLCHVGRVDAHYWTQCSLLQCHWVHQGPRLCRGQLTVTTTRDGSWKIRFLSLRRRCQTPSCSCTVTTTTTPTPIPPATKFYCRNRTSDDYNNLSIRWNTTILGWTYISTNTSCCRCHQSMRKKNKTILEITEELIIKPCSHWFFFLGGTLFIDALTT